MAHISCRFQPRQIIREIYWKRERGENISKFSRNYKKIHGEIFSSCISSSNAKRQHRGGGPVVDISSEDVRALVCYIRESHLSIRCHYSSSRHNRITSMRTTRLTRSRNSVANLANSYGRRRRKGSVLGRQGATQWYYTPRQRPSH